MLTLAPPHRADEGLDDTVARLYGASEWFFRSPGWRRWAKRLGVVGRVRVLDATHGGPNGCHPHFHIALFPTRATIPAALLALPDDAFSRPAFQRKSFQRVDTDLVDAMVRALKVEPLDPVSTVLPIQPLRCARERLRAHYLDEQRGELLDAWEAAVRNAGTRIENRTHFREVSLKLTPCEDASAYFTKWGLSDEIGAPTAKSRNHLRLLDAVAAGVDRAGDAFIAFRRATHGRAWVTGLGDVCKRYEVTSDDCLAFQEQLRERRKLECERAGTPLVEFRPLELAIQPHLYPGALAIGWPKLFELVDEIDARGGDVQRELDAVLWTARLDSRLPRRGRGPP